MTMRARSSDTTAAANSRWRNAWRSAESWLSRYLELARLPTDIVAAFASPHAIGISHAAILAPLLRADDQRDRIVAEAKRLAAEQGRLVATW